jgi:Fe-S-cluster containining protein
LEHYREKAKEIINSHIKELSNYCINKCKAQCCQRGGLVLLDEKELKIIAGNKLNSYIKNKIITQNTDTKNYYYNLEKIQCRHLAKNYICKVHSKKPRVCTDYPIFILKNYIITANNCPAIKEGIMNQCFEELKQLGYKII